MYCNMSASFPPSVCIHDDEFSPLVNRTSGSEVIGILLSQSLMVLRPGPVITDLGFME